MRKPNHVSRREFVRLSGLAADVAGAALPATGQAEEKVPVKRDPDAVMARLLEGNKRFEKGELAHPGRKPGDFVPLAEGQAPLAVVVGCADSRVAPELIFDQGVGDLFVVRLAGNVVSGAGASVKGSIEYAVAELGVRLVLVLGHSQCGAVKAAIQHIKAKDTPRIHRRPRGHHPASCRRRPGTSPATRWTTSSRRTSSGAWSGSKAWNRSWRTRSRRGR